MLTGRLIYRSDVSGDIRIKASPFELKSFEPRVDHITVDFSDIDRIQFTINFNEVDSEEMAGGIGERISRQLIDRISFLKKIQLSDPIRIGGAIHPLNPDPQSENISAVSGQFGIGTNLTTSKLYRLDEEGIAALQLSLGQAQLQGESALPLFRLVLRSDDITEQFMLLYAMLLAYVGSKQEDVNRFIRSCEPNVEERHSPWNKQDEPVYTWLRNELAHYQRTQGTSLAYIREQMANRLDGLQRLVQKAINALPV